MINNLTTASLRRRRTSLLRKLKSTEACLLRGSLIERYKRCGKAGCKCMTGRGHGPKHYLSVSFSGRQPNMIYVPQDMVKDIESCLENFKNLKIIMDEISDINREILIRREGI